MVKLEINMIDVSDNNSSRRRPMAWWVRPLVGLGVFMIIFWAIAVNLDNISSRSSNWFLEQFKSIGGMGINPSVTNQPVETTVTVVDEESAVIDVVDKVSPSVVSVLEQSVTFDLFTGPQQTEASIGTGFAVGKDLVITNKHVVLDEASTYTVVDNNDDRYLVEKIYRDPLNDLAILKITNADFTPVNFGDSDKVKIGQTAIAIGNALGRFSNTVTKGVISGKGRGITASGQLGQFQENIDDVLQTDAALNPGNSGGPLLNVAGQAVGVNVAVGVGTEGIGFAIPSNTAQGLLNDFKAGVERQKAFLGIRYVAITADFARNSTFPEGALVREVVNGAAADKAGIKVNDVVTEVGGQAVNEHVSLSSLILKYRVGDRVSVTVWRSGQVLTLQVTLEAAAN